MPELDFGQTYYPANSTDEIHTWREHYHPHEWVEDPMDAFLIASFGPKHFPMRTKVFRAALPMTFVMSFRSRPPYATIFNYLMEHKVEVQQ